MRRILSMLSILCCCTLAVSAQQQYTVSGYVKDIRTGETIIGANIVTVTDPIKGTVTNNYGYFSISLSAGPNILEISYIGMETQRVELDLKADTPLNITLLENVSRLEEVVISSERCDENVARVAMGVEKVNMQQVNKLPVIAGERDIMKTLQMMPGVKSAGEAASGFFVRGGTQDQNLILLDEAPVYNPSHMLGFFSVFNPDAIKTATLYKGNIPAEFGGRSSSVLDVRMKEGNNQKFGVDGGIGLIASRLSVQGPLKKDKSSFMLSGRRTYADLFLGQVDEEPMASSRINFYDLNAKVNYRFGDKDVLYLSGYFGADRFKLGSLFDVDWSNATATARWNHTFGDLLFGNTSLIFSNYSYQVAQNRGGNSIYNESTIRDYNFKQDFNLYANSWGDFDFGLQSIYHTLNPGVVSSEKGKKATTLDLERTGWENAIYIAHKIDLGQKFKAEYGLRFSAFSLLGAGDFYNSDAEGTITDTISYSRGEHIKSWYNLEPRAALNYRLTDKSSLKAAYSRNVQHLHLLTNGSLSMPTDIWIPNSLKVQPEIADQTSLGYFRNLKENAYEFSVEIYYKDMQNVIDFRDAADVEFNPTVETEILLGKGRAYGLELLLKKKAGRFTGWLGYTLSRTERLIEGINNNMYYPSRQDRTHDITLVAMYELNKRWSLSANWVYYTGNAVTFPDSKYPIDGMVFNNYSERNAYRMPPYHRLDLSAVWQRRKTEKIESSWTFSFYNAYGRENAYIIDFRQSATNATRSEMIQTSLFRWIPAITYNFKF